MDEKRNDIKPINLNNFPEEQKNIVTKLTTNRKKDTHKYKKDLKRASQAIASSEISLMDITGEDRTVTFMELIMLRFYAQMYNKENIDLKELKFLAELNGDVDKEKIVINNNLHNSRDEILEADGIIEVETVES